MTSCISSLSVVGINYHDQKQFQEEKVYFDLWIQGNRVHVGGEAIRAGRYGVCSRKLADHLSAQREQRENRKWAEAINYQSLPLVIDILPPERYGFLRVP